MLTNVTYLPHSSYQFEFVTAEVFTYKLQYLDLVFQLAGESDRHVRQQCSPTCTSEGGQHQRYDTCVHAQRFLHLQQDASEVRCVSCQSSCVREQEQRNDLQNHSQVIITYYQLGATWESVGFVSTRRRLLTLPDFTWDF